MTTLCWLPKVIFFAPILEYPPAGGPQLSVVNAVKVLHQICELHIITTVPVDRADAGTTLRFFKEHCHALVQAPTSHLAAKAKVVDKILRRCRRLASPVFAAIDVPYVIRYADNNSINIFWIDRVLEHARSRLSRNSSVGTTEDECNDAKWSTTT